MHAPEAALLRHEAAMYARAESLQGGALPRVFGLFESPALRHAHNSGHHGDGITVLVMEHRGAGVKRMGALSWGQRISLYTALQALHAHGVAHGDLRADNIVVSRAGVPTLIDLSHARAHVCSGEGRCEELREGRAFFRMGECAARTLDLLDSCYPLTRPSALPPPDCCYSME
ncbi:hypothetical protein DFH06DRAFT_1001770 [Mycena polygramma]|nr:hypothetical protein DFH06DRAFT_1001770 [Mycena polygramma]